MLSELDLVDLYSEERRLCESNSCSNIRESAVTSYSICTSIDIRGLQYSHVHISSVDNSDADFSNDQPDDAFWLSCVPIIPDDRSVVEFNGDPIDVTAGGWGRSFPMSIERVVIAVD